MKPMPGIGKDNFLNPAMSAPGVYIPPGASLVIKIEEKAMMISPQNGGMIQDLSNEQRHLVKIIMGGRQVQSFWLDFRNEGSNDLCLWYYQGYGTISLKPSSDKNCGCHQIHR